MSKEEVEGKRKRSEGAVRDAAGKLAGDKSERVKGKVEEAEGRVEEAAGKAARKIKGS